MKTSELIKLLQEEFAAFGDRDVVMFCPEHSGTDGEPVAVHGIGWYGHVEKDIRATFLECIECHEEGIREEAEVDAMVEIDASSASPGFEDECGW